MTVVNPFDFFVEPYATSFPFRYTDDLKTELAPYLATSEQGRIPALERHCREPTAPVDFLVDLNAHLQQTIRYLIRMEPGVQTPEETLTVDSGSCRDSAWLLVQILRHLGLAARFVSGYLIQCSRHDPVDGPRGVERDFTDLHAWAEVYLPGAGWIGLDATSGLLTGEGHIPWPPRRIIARPRRSPARRPANVEFDFDMTVKRIGETPRVTLPFSEESWAELDALGEQVDADLKQDDVRLTMGGEPTFVSIDDLIAGMEHRRGRADQAGPRRRTDPPPARPFRAGRLPALRPGQMVSRRKPAALGLRALLAQGRRSRSGRMPTGSPEENPRKADIDRCRASCGRRCAKARPRSRICHAGL